MQTRTRRPAPRRVLRALLAGGATVILLSACQTGTEPGGDESPSPSVTEDATEPETSPTEESPSADGSDGPQEGGVVNGPNSITAPTPGETVAGPSVTVTGEGTAFEATLNYHVLDAGTDALVVGPDYTMAGANGEVGPYTIELTLDPGEYTVQVWEPDMAEGDDADDPYRNLVEVTFTVE